MRYCRYTPADPLSAFVHCFWYWAGAPTTHSKEKLLPNGEHSIIFNLRDEAMRIYDVRNLNRFEAYGRAVLSGARADCFVIDTNQQECVFGIQFRPGGAFPFMGVPASEVEGRTVDLEDVWPGRAAGEIREQLLAAGSDVRKMFRVMERALLRRLVRPLALHPAVQYAVTEFAGAGDAAAVRVGDVTERIGLSSRRFIEVFHRQVGLTPKVFYRVRRFQRVLEQLHGPTALAQRNDLEWADLALMCGYYDQAHFIHDFQAFSGLTPSGYLAAATQHLNHVPMEG